MNRKSVRALMLTDEPAVLLMKFAVPGPDGEIWITPGGGMMSGETREEALRREVYEETGLEDFDMGPLVWTREHTFRLNGLLVTQTEEFFLVSADRFEPTVNYLEVGEERDEFLELRWWCPDEIRRSSETFVPRRMSHHLDGLIANGLPNDPVNVGI